MSESDNIFSSRNRLPCLDGWRALAITMVMGSHCWWVEGYPSDLNPFLKTFLRIGLDGNLGVRIFFVISGFLITLLMLRESHASRFSLKSFWYRRILRILPVYCTFLLVLYLLQVFTPFEMSSKQWIAVLTFTANTVPLEWTTAHLWSLSVEEQFYLAWPLLYYFFSRNTTILAIFALIAIVISIVSRFLLLENVCTVTNLDSLAIGCTMAYVSYWRGRFFSEGSHLFGLVVISLMLIIIPRMLLGVDSVTFLVAPIMPLMQAIGFGMLMVTSVARSGDLWTQCLQWKPVAWLGTLSYSLYMWQQLFCTRAEVYGLDSVWWLRFPGWILPSLVVAVMSYYLIEMPALRLKKRSSPPPRIIEGIR